MAELEKGGLGGAAPDVVGGVRADLTGGGAVRADLTGGGGVRAGLSGGGAVRAGLSGEAVSAVSLWACGSAGAGSRR